MVSEYVLSDYSSKTVFEAALLVRQVVFLGLTKRVPKKLVQKKIRIRTKRRQAEFQGNNLNLNKSLPNSGKPKCFCSRA